MQGLLSQNFLSKASIFGGGGGSNIKNIQRGTGITNDNDTVDITISEVDLSCSIVLISFWCLQDYISKYYCTAKFTNSTTLRIQRGASDTQDVSFAWVVIEFNNVKSIQSGELYIEDTSTSRDITINTIDPSKSFSLVTFRTSANGTVKNTQIKRELASNALSLSHSSLYGGYIVWQVIEFE